MKASPFCRSFNIILEPERKLFHPGFTLIRNGKKVSKHDSFTYMYSGVETSEFRLLVVLCLFSVCPSPICLSLVLEFICLFCVELICLPLVACIVACFLLVDTCLFSLSLHTLFVYKFSPPPTSLHSHSGDPISRVYGNLAQGVFDGTIETSEGVYHVEPSFRYVFKVLTLI